MASRQLDHVQEFHQFMGEGENFLLPFAPAFLRLLQSYDAPAYMNYDFVMAVSGAATRLSWQQGWAGYQQEPNIGDLFITGDRLTEIRKGMEGAGLEYDICLCGPAGWRHDQYQGDVVWVEAESARRELVAAIDEGHAVLINTGNPEIFPALVTGYENDGEKFTFRHLFMNQDKSKPPVPYLVTGSDWHGKDIVMYCRISDFCPRPVDRSLLRLVMLNVIERAQPVKLGHTATGIGALQQLAEHLVWDDGFEPLAVNEAYSGELSWQYQRPDGYYREDGARTLRDRFWAGYCDFLCMLNGYSNLRSFLLAHAEVVPEWADRLHAAAREAERACEYSGELWRYVTPDDAGVEKFKTKDVRSIFAAQMIRVKIHTVRLMELVESCLAEG